MTYRPMLAYYAGWNGLNAILPASAGTVAMLGLFRTDIEGSTVAGLAGATVVENIFFAITAALVYLWLFLSVPGSFDVKLGWFSDHPGLTLVPGAVGAQTGLASVVLKGVAPQAAISAYAIGQAIITTAWNVVFGLTLLAGQIGWQQTRSLVHVRKKKTAQTDSG